MIYNNDKLIAAAFVKARAEIGGTVAEDGTGNYGKYVTLAAIAKATTAILASHGLAIIQEAELHEGGVTIETYLLHESGATMQFAALTMPLAQRTAQAVGSAMTYGRRYQWAAVCGLAGDDDDDGEAATNAPAKGKTQGKAPQAAPVVASQAQQNRLHAVGMEYHGSKDEWEKARPIWVKAACKGGTEVASSKDLSPKQADWIIAAIETKLADRNAKASTRELVDSAIEQGAVVV